MAPADSQDRQVPLQGGAAKSQLEVVALPRHPAQLRMGLRAIERRVDVGAAAEEQPLDPIEQLRRVLGAAGGQDHGQAAALLDGAHVVLPQGIEPGAALVGADRDADGRTRPHIFSGIGIPRTSSSSSICSRKASTTDSRKARRSGLSAYSTE